MSITSIYFLFVFLPIVLVVYYIAGSKAKEYVLAFFSIAFYALGSLSYLALFASAICLTILIGRTMQAVKNKTLRTILLIAGILANVCMLVYYKYTDFALSTFARITATELTLKNLILPLGISFFTFKAISYLIDIYKEKVVLSKHVVTDVLYLSFFAQIQAGPLTRYHEMKRDNARAFDLTLFCNGVYRFMTGFCKKVLIADVLANLTDIVFSTKIEQFSMGYAWLGAICFSLQIYFDFSGYSDMAIGISNLFGYHCMENFNYPYMTESVAKFWRRWHISLSEWFRDYVYFPLGGSRCERKWRLYFNLLVVWLLTGIWHGASWKFVVWGFGYFLAISFERLTKLPERMKTRAGKMLYRILTLLFINFQWVIFHAASFKQGALYIKCMIFCRGNELTNLRTVLMLKEYGAFILVAILLSFPLVPKLEEKTRDKKLLHGIFSAGIAIIVIAAFICSLSFVVAGQNNPFAYANF